MKYFIIFVSETNCLNSISFCSEGKYVKLRTYGFEPEKIFKKLSFEIIVDQKYQIVDKALKDKRAYKRNI